MISTAYYYKKIFDIKLAGVIIIFFLCFYVPFLQYNIFAQNDEIENNASAQDSGSLRPKVEFAASGLRDPFKDYITPEEIDIGKKPVEPQKGETLNPPELKIEGLIWGGAKPCAIINGEVKKEGEIIDGVTILEINKEGLVILYEGKKYTLSSVTSIRKPE